MYKLYSKMGFSPQHFMLCWVPKLLVLRIARRKKVVVLYMLLMVAVLMALPSGWWLAKAVGHVLMLPDPPMLELTHFLKSRNMRQYLSEIDPIIEPVSSVCETVSSFEVLILIASVPHNVQRREIIRQTWAKYQPTFFVLGMHRTSDSILSSNYLEAKRYNDVIVFDFLDHYQNLTLKTALMLRWASDNCPQAKFLLKTDDDVMVNPWTLQKVVRDHPGAQLVGFSINNTKLHRDKYNKYYVPRWLCHDNMIDQYLSGTGYLVNGAYIKKILHSSYTVPLVNIEDVYITYLVAKRSLNLTLTHDQRLRPTKPWVPFICVYWNQATVHSIRPVELRRIWPELHQISKSHGSNKKICSGYKFFDRDFFMY